MKPIHLVLLHEGPHCIPCEYMARVVESVVPEFGDAVHVEIVVTTKLEGGMRYQEISRDLGRPAPVPSIFIEGKLIYDQTPGREELRACLGKFMRLAD